MAKVHSGIKNLEALTSKLKKSFGGEEESKTVIEEAKPEVKKPLKKVSLPKATLPKSLMQKKSAKKVANTSALKKKMQKTLAGKKAQKETLSLA